MSSEERITKIENLLQALMESQVHFQAQAEHFQAQADQRHVKADAEMAELRQLSKASDERLDRHIEFVTKAITQAEQQIAKTAAAQEITEQRLQNLIGKVDGVDNRVTKLEKKKP